MGGALRYRRVEVEVSVRVVDTLGGDVGSYRVVATADDRGTLESLTAAVGRATETVTRGVQLQQAALVEHLRTRGDA